MWGFFPILLSFLSFVSFAKPPVSQIRIGEPRYEGTGCLPGTVGKQLSDDQSELSVLFDDYRVEALPGIVSQTKFCTVTLPIDGIPPGKALEISQVDYRGYNALPKGAQSIFKTRHALVSAQGHEEVKTFDSKDAGDFFYRRSDRIQSKCTGSVTLEMFTQLMIKNPSKQESALSSIDTFDMTTGQKDRNRKVKFKIKLTKC